MHGVERGKRWRYNIKTLPIAIVRAAITLKGRSRRDKRLVEAGQITGIHLIDHLIIGDEKYVSLKENGRHERMVFAKGYDGINEI
jgi:hypothetical protein